MYGYKPMALWKVKKMASDMDCVGPFFAVMHNSSNNDDWEWWEPITITDNKGTQVFYNTPEEAWKALDEFIKNNEFENLEKYKVAEIELGYKFLQREPH